MTVRFSRLAACAALFVLLLAGGCIQADLAFSLRKDGSGTIEAEYAMSEQTISQIAAMLKLKEQLVRSAGETYDSSQDRYTRVFLDPDAAKIEREVDKYAALGLAIDELKVETRSAWRYVTMRLSFPDVGKLSQADFFPEYGFSLTRRTDGKYVLQRESPGPHALPSKEEAERELRLLSPLLGGFRVQTKIVAPGRVQKETNATRTSLYSATWTFNFDKDPTAVAAFRAHNVHLVFDGKGLSLPEISREVPDDPGEG
jgi:hypothetical protein